LQFEYQKGIAYGYQMGLRPQTLYGIADSPVGHYNKLDKGGHFAAWEQPQVFSEEVRAGFRSLRKLAKAA
jgi:pimeloyl-ACP methyl ester carboxylesterase